MARNDSHSPDSGESLRASENRHKFLNHLLTATQSLTEPEEIMKVTAKLLAEFLDVDRCAYAEVTNEDLFVITGDYARGVPTIVGNWPIAAFGKECTRCMLENEAYVVTNVQEDERITAADRDAYRATTIEAVICVPLHKGNVLTAAMAVHQKHPRVWTEEEIYLVTTVVNRCWEALERSRIDRSLRASESRYRAIVEATPECVKLVAADGTLLQMNPAGLQMIEAESSPVGGSVYDLIAPEHRESFKLFNERICRGAKGQLEYDIIGHKGTRRHMETAAVPLSNADGTFTHLAVTRDVSERVAAQRALDENRARLNYAAQIAGIGFWYTDLPFDILDWDDLVKQHFWLKPDAKVTIETFYERLHPDDRERTRQLIDECIRDRRPYSAEYRTVNPADGSVKWIRAIGGAFYGADGTPVKFDGVTADITTRKLDEERLGRLYDELRDQDRRKDEFLAILAHELRNPLAPLRYGLEVLRMGKLGEDELLGIRNMMDRQLTHMVRLIDDLLDISRINRNKMELRLARVELSEVIRSAVEIAKPMIDSAAHRFSISLPHEPVVLHADHIRLAQVFGNLLSNSAKYTPSGGNIWLKAERDSDYIAISVHDNGIGIPQRALPMIFNMFGQVDRATEKNSGGMGIGLALVRGLVEMHGGKVEASSPGEGMGSTFIVRLPVSKNEDRPKTESAPSTAKVQRTRILIADDNLDSASALSMMLKMHGHEVRTVYDGLEAVSVAADFLPQIILMDLGMPKMNGYEATQQIKSTSHGQKAKIYALTGWGQDADRARSAAAGCDGHFVKPVNIEQLKTILASYEEKS